MDIIISIIMPIYQAESTLQRAINSVRIQTFNNWELILIDDASTDKSRQIAQENADIDSRIKLIIKDRNEGAAAARNDALVVKRGEYITFLDSDDWIEPQELQEGYEYALKHKADVVVWGAYQEMESKNRKILPVVISPKEKLYKGDLQVIESIAVLEYEKVFPYLWNKLYKVNIVSDIRFQNLKIGEDHLYNLMAFSHANTIVTIPNVNYHYMQKPFSTLSTMYIPEYYNLMKTIHTNIKNIFIEKKADEKSWNLIFNVYNKILVSTIKRVWQWPKDIKFKKKIQFIRKVLSDVETIEASNHAIPLNKKDALYCALLKSRSILVNVLFSYSLNIVESKASIFYYHLK